MLIFAELSCWTCSGVHKSDPRLMILGFTGVAASLLMLARIRRTTEIERSICPGVTSAECRRPQPGRR